MPVANFTKLLQDTLQGNEEATLRWRDITKLTDEEITETNQAIEKILTENAPQKSHALNLKGYITQLGWGQPKDEEQAIKYFIEAAELNNPFAILNLAQIYSNDQRTREHGLQAYEKGIELAIQNHLNQIAGLALYSNAKVLMKYKKDFLTARACFQKASELDYHPAKKALKKIHLREEQFSDTLKKLAIFERKHDEFIERSKSQTLVSKIAFYESKARAVRIITDIHRAIIEAIIYNDADRAAILGNQLASDPEIIAAGNILDQHDNNTKQLLVDILMAIVTIGVSLLYTLATGNRFFTVPTDSINKWSSFVNQLALDAQGMKAMPAEYSI